MKPVLRRSRAAGPSRLQADFVRKGDRRGVVGPDGNCSTLARVTGAQAEANAASSRAIAMIQLRVRDLPVRLYVCLVGSRELSHGLVYSAVSVTDLGLSHEQTKAAKSRAAALRARLSALDAERESLVAELSALESLSAASELLQRIHGAPDRSGARHPAARRSPSPQPAGADRSTAAVLRESLSPTESASLAELTDLVLAAGLLTDSPNPRAAVRVALTRMVKAGEAVKAARGRWAARKEKRA